MEGLRNRAAAFVGLALLSGPLCAARQASDPAEVAKFAPLAAVLAALETGLEPVTAAQRVHALGSPAASILFVALGRDELPLGEGSLALGAREHTVLLEGARQLGREPFVPLWGEAASGADARARRTAIELVGRVGKAADLGTAILAASPTEPGSALDPEALLALEVATAGLLARDHGTHAFLRPAILHASPEVAGHLIRAAGHAPNERTLELFADILGLETALDLPLLSQIARLTRGQPPPFDERVRERVRAYLADPDRQVVRAAAMALAEMQDEDAVPLLLDLTAGTDAALAGAAFLALERTTGLSLPRRTERWRAWLAVEQDWWTKEEPRQFEALNSGDVRQTVAALREVACHRLGRQSLAAAVAHLLTHRDRAVRLEACRTLQALATPVARAALEQTLEDGDREVATAAACALRALGAASASS